MTTHITDGRAAPSLARRVQRSWSPAMVSLTWIGAIGVMIWNALAPLIMNSPRAMTVLEIMMTARLAVAFRWGLGISLGAALGSLGLSLLLCYGALRGGRMPWLRGLLHRCSPATAGVMVPLVCLGTVIVCSCGALPALAGTKVNRQLEATDCLRLSLACIVVQLPLLIGWLVPILRTLTDADAVTWCSDTVQDAQATPWLTQLIPALLGVLPLMIGATCGLLAAARVSYGQQMISLTYLLVDAQRHDDVPVSPMLAAVLNMKLIGVMLGALAAVWWIQRLTSSRQTILTLAVLCIGRWLWRALAWCFG